MSPTLGAWDRFAGSGLTLIINRRPMDSSIEKPLERLVAACHGETLQLKGEREESSNGRKDDDKLHKGQLPHQGLRPWSRPHRGDRGEDDCYEQSLPIWSHHFDLVSPGRKPRWRGAFSSRRRQEPEDLKRSGPRTVNRRGEGQQPRRGGGLSDGLVVGWRQCGACTTLTRK